MWQTNRPKRKKKKKKKIGKSLSDGQLLPSGGGNQASVVAYMEFVARMLFECCFNLEIITVLKSHTVMHPTMQDSCFGLAFLLECYLFSESYFVFQCLLEFSVMWVTELCTDEVWPSSHMRAWVSERQLYLTPAECTIHLGDPVVPEEYMINRGWEKGSCSNSSWGAWSPSFPVAKKSSRYTLGGREGKKKRWRHGKRVKQEEEVKKRQLR